MPEIIIIVLVILILFRLWNWMHPTAVNASHDEAFDAFADPGMEEATDDLNVANSVVFDIIDGTMDAINGDTIHDND